MNCAWRVQLRLPAAMLVVLLAWQAFAPRAWAVISGSGNFSPVLPAAGGTINGEVIVGVGNTAGDILFGTISIDGATVLADTDGIVGDLHGAFGEVSLNGLGTAWNHGNELTVGNEGFGRLTVQSMARINVTDDMFIGRVVTGQGEVRLLDFGVARLLRAETGGASLTQDWGRALTPAYASPELLRG